MVQKPVRPEATLCTYTAICMHTAKFMYIYVYIICINMCVRISVVCICTYINYIYLYIYTRCLKNAPKIRTANNLLRGSVNSPPHTLLAPEWQALGVTEPRDCNIRAEASFKPGYDRRAKMPENRLPKAFLTCFATCMTFGLCARILQAGLMILSKLVCLHVQIHVFIHAYEWITSTPKAHRHRDCKESPHPSIPRALHPDV